jgi:hypothetical protein
MKLNRIFPEATDDVTRASTCSAMLKAINSSTAAASSSVQQRATVMCFEVRVRGFPGYSEPFLISTFNLNLTVYYDSTLVYQISVIPADHSTSSDYSIAMPNNSGSAESGSQDNPVNVNSELLSTILGLYSLIQNNYIIDHIIPKPSPVPVRTGKVLRLLVALASVLVRGIEVVAVALANEVSDELSLIASVGSDSELNFVTCENPWSREKQKSKSYSITELKIDTFDLYPYLLKKW